MPGLSDDISAAIDDLHREQARISKTGAQAVAVTATVTSKDRMVTATVDGQGRVTALKLTGTKYQKMAPAELCTRIVETMRQAQEDATRQSMAVFAKMMPDDLGSFLGGKTDLDAMVAAAMETASQPLFPDSDRRKRGENSGR
ncbi:YbaB/EbfC family nucleoid-associated protein [Kineosporia sp. NBRC 101731]|uniref:YbaB/EbfC family nucleoid-associated protein n=1 Tax=Kineosporia sp. NBRC 101731 TaxID=3032199 RepID=UPI0024A0598B|nr:YbaB/EbfC family nucleoid-associated protein [Kineosporia sp. NBRC 101731]GLY28942.1 hypothetical protein Kisp02_23070 [Kineosporia sp. NBRC 101731]